MILNYITSTIGSYPFLLVTITLSFLFKLFIFSYAIKQLLHTTIRLPLWALLAVILFANMTSDITWIIKISTLLFISMDYRIMLFIIRIAWAFAIIQYQALALFLEHLVVQDYKLPIHQKIYCTITTCYVLLQIGLAFIYFNNSTPAMRPPIELIFFHSLIWYKFFIIIPSLFVTIQKLRTKNFPLILKKQLHVLIKTLMIPSLISDFIQVNPFKMHIFSFEHLTHSLSVVGVSTILLSIALLYCARKIMGLRFLNTQNHVKSGPKLHFINDFKVILEQFSQVTSTHELEHITKNFFKEALTVPLTKTRLFLRNVESYPKKEKSVLHHYDTTDKTVEELITINKFNINELIKKQKVFIYDEIDFSYFYNQSDEQKNLLNFLQVIDADIFLPIYEQNKVIAYIIIERHARMNTLYNSAEQDEMIVFASYLGKIINLVKNRTLETFIEQEQILKKELYLKHQEINQYKESIRSFLRTNKQRKFGIIFYKDRKFTFANQDAKELIPININRQEGHPLTRTLKRIAQQVTTYKAPQHSFAKDIQGNTLVFSAVPHSRQDNVIIAIFYPEISDIVKQHIDSLKDPTEWDYLLYLQTTKSGQLINKLLPGAGETILNFKIALLKTALSNKAILLDAPEKDLLPTVELLHHISLRETLHILDLERTPDATTVAIKLFGINPIFSNKTQNKPPLLEALDKTGTLFIKKIDQLDFECQNYLAEFIRYGLYRKFKSEQRFSSNVRIICSSNQNLLQLVERGKFSKILFQELKRTTLVMPSLLTLPVEELSMLADGFSQQSITTQTFENLLGLSNRDKNKLAYKRPKSLQELKIKVQQIIIEKSKKHDIYEETYFDPAHETTDPELIEAARLGRHALKDQRIMTILWKKFDKSQSNIATFLGVNRSSVHRRLKKYGLE